MVDGISRLWCKWLMAKVVDSASGQWRKRMMEYAVDDIGS